MTQRQAERLLDEQTQRMLQPSARLVICGPCWTLRAYHPHCQLKIINAFAEFPLLATKNSFPHQPSFADLLGEWEGGLVKLLRTLACTCLAWGANGRYHTWASCALGETVFFFFRFLSLSLSLTRVLLSLPQATRRLVAMRQMVLGRCALGQKVIVFSVTREKAIHVHDASVAPERPFDVQG